MARFSGRVSKILGPKSGFMSRKKMVKPRFGLGGVFEQERAAKIVIKQPYAYLINSSIPLGFYADRESNEETLFEEFMTQEMHRYPGNQIMEVECLTKNQSWISHTLEQKGLRSNEEIDEYEDEVEAYDDYEDDIGEEEEDG